MRSATFSLLLVALLLAVASSQASAAAKPKLVVSAPTTAPGIAGRVVVDAALSAKRSAKVRVARFYVNGSLVTTDRGHPFKIKRGVKFDTRQLPTSRPYLTLVVKYEQRKKNGKIAKKSIKKSIRVSFVPVNSNVKAQGTLTPAQCVKSPAPEASKFGYPLAFSDDFECASLDAGVWNTQRYDTLDNPAGEVPPFPRPFNALEGAAYATDNVSVSDGALKLTLTDTTAPGQLDTPAKKSRATGMVNTRNKFSFKYGYVETRAWVSDCVGCWPTFWIMPQNDDWPPEIDIFEFINPIGDQKRFPHSIVHWAPDGAAGDVQPPNQHFVSAPGDPAQEWFVTHPAGQSVDYMGAGEWHTYGMLWTATSVKFYVDGVLGSQVVGTTKLPQQPVYLIYQMAIGNSSFGVPPAGSTLSVDYLRVFSSTT